MNLCTVAVYILKMCMKEDNPDRKNLGVELKGDN